MEQYVGLAYKREPKEVSTLLTGINEKLVA